MKKKNLKESIQKSIKENILNEKITDIIPQAVSGIANMGRNISGQFSLGGINKRLERAGNRIERDWKDSADYVQNKAQKLSQSKNDMIAQQANAVLNKVGQIDSQIQQALSMMNVPAEQIGQQQRGGIYGDPSHDPFAKHPMQLDFEKWIKATGADLRGMSKNRYGQFHQKWLQMVSLGLDPKNISIQDLQREVALAAHKHDLELARMNKELKGQNEFGMGLGKEHFPQGQEQELSDEDMEEVPQGKPPARPPAAPKMPSKPSAGGRLADLQKQQQAAKQATAGMPPPAKIGDPNSRINQAERALYMAKGSENPDPEEIAAWEKRVAFEKQARQQELFDQMFKKPSPPGQPQAISGPSAAGMEGPAQQKGKAAPPPVSHPGTVQPKTAHKPLEIPKYPEAEPEPIPLTKLKPHKPAKPTMEMPPREIVGVVPRSIKSVLPPIKDDGQTIQVGSEEKPAAAPRNEPKNPRKPKTELEKEKERAEKTKNPKDIEKYTKSLEKDVVKSKTSKKTSKK